MKRVGLGVLILGLLLEAHTPAAAAAVAGDSVRWLPYFQGAETAQVVDRYTYSEPCGTGSETWPAPLWFSGSISRDRVRRLGRELFRSLPPVRTAPRVVWDTSSKEYRTLEIRFRAGRDSLRVLLDEERFLYDRCSIWRRRNGVVVDSLVVERLHPEVRFEVFGTEPDSSWSMTR